nr:phage tail protein [uncultured Blautia sp.]
MYTIKAYVDGEEYTIHDSRVKALTVGGKPYFEVGDNINGSASFSVYPNHPYYDKVKKLTTDIIFYRDDEPEFYGRVLYDDEDFSGTKKVFVEGELAFLCDSIQRPKVYHNISVKAYVQDLIDIHNSQVEERKQFTVGRVTVKDSNDSLYRYSNYEDTRTTFKEKLISRLGGHLVIRHVDGLRILDYLSDEDYYTKNTQGIRFGKNLLDFSKNMDASDLVTCVIPLGAKLDEEDQDPSLEAISDQRITIASVNGGVDYVTDDNAVREYGKIYKTVTWDDVSLPENLMKKGEEYLKSAQFEKMVLELKAVDLNLKDDSFQRFEVGNKIQCTSTPNGLDKEFPLTKKKTYITSFKDNTVTLGDETSSVSYTSSNRQNTAEMEKTIKSLPSKSEILQEALRSAQDLINKQVASGYAVHVPNEFIVADDVDYKNKAKNLWRWGLGGFAHYSHGYDGPIDGVALTMDGKINGEMLLVNSVKTESLDAGYRTSVETKISESETAAKEHADDKVRVAREEIENSISNLENKISLSVRSVKETVARKNYIVGGEQETLNLDKFTLSGSTGICKVEKAEFLNKNAFKLTFSGTGSITLTQSLGTLEAGNYKIAVEAAYPEGARYRPSYIQYGFSENKSTAYLSGYKADEFQTFGKEVKITKATKSVAITVYGNSGNILYVTDIRCLRDMQELLDDLNARVDVEIGKVSASVSEVYENSLHNYCSNGSFSDSKDKFTGWSRSDTAQITQTTFNNRSCAKIQNTTSTYNISWYQKPWAKKGNVTVRFKAACASEDASTARIRVTIDGKTFYTAAGELSSIWKQFEFTSYATPSYFYTYFYNYVANTTVYITDVEILGYLNTYAESQLSILKDSITAEVTRAQGAEEKLTASIKVNANNITSKVSKGDMGSYITQYYNNVIIAFNKNSKYVQINPGEIAIYNYGVENSKKRAVFDESGNHFYRDGYYVGAIGTNQWSGNNAHKGLVFDLESQGKYMAFAQKASASATSYTTMLCFSRANSIYDEYGVNLGCNLIGNWYTLKNFKIGSISAGGYTAFSGAIPIVCEITNNGNSWTYSHLRVYNGIIVGYWN